MKRQEFMKVCSVACLGGMGLSSLLQSCATPNYFAIHTIERNRIRINASEFETVVKDQTVKRPYVLVKNNQLEFPICVYRFSDNDFSALYLKCTHQGCEVQPQGEFLVCPCHGSEYSNQGKVINPPAEKDLGKFPVGVEATSIIIQF